MSGGLRVAVFVCAGCHDCGVLPQLGQRGFIGVLQNATKVTVLVAFRLPLQRFGGAGLAGGVLAEVRFADPAGDDGAGALECFDAAP